MSTATKLETYIPLQGTHKGYSLYYQCVVLSLTTVLSRAMLSVYY